MNMYAIVFILFFTLNEVVGIFYVHTSLVTGKNANSVYYYNKFKKSVPIVIPNCATVGRF